MSLQVSIFFNRIRIEERLLAEQFGDTRRKYKKITGELIPFFFWDDHFHGSC